MWADDLEIVESCGFDLSLSYFDSINSIGVFAATDTFAHMKGPSVCVCWGMWAYVCMCVDLCVGLCVCIFLRSPKVVVTDTCFWSFLPHLWAPMGDPFTPPEPLLTKRSSMLATVMIFMERKPLVAIETLHSHPWSCCFSHVCFGPFLPYLYMVTWSWATPRPNHNF